MAVEQPLVSAVEHVRQPPAGIVKPPRDIQAIVEKTAGYVERNGKVFEDRIRDKEQGNPKFSFLNPGDAYAPFYTWRLQEISEGRGTAISAGRAGESATSTGGSKKTTITPPPEFLFSARMPNISAQDLDVIRLTALFVAKNGRAFMTTLAQRESRNFQFDFLRPQHSLHQFFSRLIDQYVLLLQSQNHEDNTSQQKRLSDLECQSLDKFEILEKAKARAAWVLHQEELKVQKEEAAQQEQVEFAQIDWHDFVIVETVLFDESDETAALPGPTSLNDLQSASLEQKAAMSLQPPGRRIEEAMPTEFDNNSPYEFASMGHSAIPTNTSLPEVAHTHNILSFVPPSHLPTSAYNNDAQVTSTTPFTANTTSYDNTNAARGQFQSREQGHASIIPSRDHMAQPVRIREDYVPRAKALKNQGQTAVCPNCRQHIPFNELEQHMKIELLDPRWKEQRQKAESRAMTTNLSTSDVAANLKRLASQRSDLFDGDAQQSHYAEEEMKRKRVLTNGFNGDLNLGVGSANAAARKAMAAAEAGRTAEVDNKGKGGSIEEQLRRIHEKAKG